MDVPGFRVMGEGAAGCRGRHEFARFRSYGANASGLKRAAGDRSDGASINWAESYFSRLRRGEAGHHHHISGAYLLRFAQESAWREDNRRVPNGEQVKRVVNLALSRKKSVDFSGYWQRHMK
jgi:hypothetical protein